jgi:hypothetical protein
MDLSIENFNNLLKSKKILIEQMKKQNMTENIQNMVKKTEEIHNEAQNTLDNITNPENLNIFSTIFNNLAQTLNLPINLITYGIGTAVGVTLLIGKFFFRYNLLGIIGNLVTNTTTTSPTITLPEVGHQQAANMSSSSFFSRIGDRIIKLVDIFIEHMSKVEYHKYK